LNLREQRQRFIGKLDAAVVKERSNDNVSDIRLKELTDFAWDRVHIFNPYTTNEKIDTDLDNAWRSAGQTSIDTLDNIILLIFTNKGKVVFYIDLPRYPVDLRGNYKQGGYSPDEAIFKVVKGAKQDNGHPWLHLIWKWRNESFKLSGSPDFSNTFSYDGNNVLDQIDKAA